MPTTGVGVLAGPLSAAQQKATFDLGHDVAYLCALPEKRSFYEAIGWRRLEENVGPHGLTVLTFSRGF
nr:hypothetical protein [Ensifer aridi]